MDERRWRLVFLSLLALGIIDRLILLFLFGFHNTSTDDVIIWEIARDYGGGFFPEPYMYGQNYNPILEALLGAPFVRMGVHPWIILPIITSLLALAPYWSFAIWNYRKGERLSACTFALMPLLLPVEWGMLTTITRGFVHGIALLALLPWAMSTRDEKWKHVLTALIAGAALFFNPNALVFLVPIGVVLLFQYARKQWFWMGSAVGMLPALLAWWAAHDFYAQYPYPMHHMIMGWELQFKPRLIGEAITRLDSHFKALMPLLWKTGHAILWSLLLAAIGLWVTRRRPQAWGIAAGLAFIFFSLGFYKVHDGVDSIFYVRSRMFLAAPLLLAWTMSESGRGRTPRTWFAPTVLVAGVGLVVLKASIATDVINREMTHQKGALVREQRVDVVKKNCEMIKAVAWEWGADAVITLRWPDLKVDPDPHFQTYFHCYGCPNTVQGFPMTYGPGYERRAWVRNKVRDKIPRDPLFVGGDPASWERAQQAQAGIQRLGDDPLLHLIQNNTMPIDSIVVRWGLGQMR